jgi:3-hydroxy-9,10-secoandrosta-1,3,5(10)-triene-9,17-dione monooxygenase
MYKKKAGRTIMDREECVRRAAELVPVLRERAPQAEALRHVPQETIDDLCRADLFRGSVPERFGGCGFDFNLILSVAAELGRGCGSTAWCYGVWAADNLIVGMYPAQAQEEYWATGVNTLCVSTLNPAGATSLTAVTGGYRLSGQWDFASGCDVATWTLVVGAGPAGVLAFLVPRSDFAIHDTWFASGLRGTGSKDIVIDDAFVPEHRVLPVTDMQEARTPGRVIHDTVPYRIPLFTAGTYPLAAPIVGMAQGTVEAFQAAMQQQTSAPRGGQVAQLIGVQVRLAEATMEVEAARLIMLHDIHEILARARRDETPTLEERLRARRNQAYVAMLCVRAVNCLFAGSGGHALFDASPLQRFHRDIHAASHHVSLSWDTASEQYGRVLLGLEPTNRRF